MMDQPQIVFNGKLVPKNDFGIGIDDLALNRGYGVFEFFSIKNNLPLFLDEHLSRLMSSAQKMHLALGSRENQLKDWVAELIHANNMTEGGMKILVTGGYSPDGYSLADPNILISGQPLPVRKMQDYQYGISVITHEYSRDMPEIKSIDYSRGIWLLPAIAAAGANDVIYTSEGYLLETPRSNVFVVDTRSKIRTAGTGVLKGITRKHVLDLASSLFEVEEGKVSTELLRTASEIFITSTTKKILPVTRVDGSAVGEGKPGPVTRALSQALEVWEENYLKAMK